MITTTKTWQSNNKIIAIEISYIWSQQNTSLYQLWGQNNDETHNPWDTTITDIQNAKIKAQSDMNNNWKNTKTAGIKARTMINTNIFPKVTKTQLWDAADRIQLWKSIKKEFTQKELDASQQLLLIGISASEASQTPTNNRDKNAINWLLHTIELEWENGSLNQNQWRVEWPSIFNQQWLANVYIPNEKMQSAISETSNPQSDF